LEYKADFDLNARLHGVDLVLLKFVDH